MTTRAVRRRPIRQLSDHRSASRRRRARALERLNELRASATVGVALGAGILAAARGRDHRPDRLGAEDEALARRLIRRR